MFVKEKSEYEMRISDWSSAVCASDLRNPGKLRRGAGRDAAGGERAWVGSRQSDPPLRSRRTGLGRNPDGLAVPAPMGGFLYRRPVGSARRRQVLSAECSEGVGPDAYAEGLSRRRHQDYRAAPHPIRQAQGGTPVPLLGFHGLALGRAQAFGPASILYAYGSG